MSSIKLNRIADITPGQVHVHGSISNISSRYAKKGIHITEAILSDGSASVRLTWFNKPRLSLFLTTHKEFEVRGEFGLSGRYLQISNPDIRYLDEGCMEFNRPMPQEKTNHSSGQNVWTKEIKGRTVSEDSFWGKLRKAVKERDNNRCTICRATYNLTVDHVVALSLGGDNKLSNLTTLCKDCHENKHHRKFLERDFDADDNYGKNYKIPEKIKVLSNAINSKTSIHIDYEDRKGQTTNRDILPRRLFKDHERIYLEAFCYLRNDGRLFRVSRITLS